MQTPTSRQRRAAALIVMAGLALAACGDDSDGDTDPDAGSTGGSTCAQAEPIEVTGAMSVFHLDGVATPTTQSESGGYLVVTAEAEGEVSDLVIKFADVVQEAGYTLAGSEDEGFEGEVFFQKDDVAAGQVKLEDSEDCEGIVDIRITLLNDPSVLPTETSSAP